MQPTPPADESAEQPASPLILAPGLGTLAARYEFVRELGRGGTAVVYLARDRDSGRNVAIKAIHADHREDPEVTWRFAREAQTMSALDHPHITRTYAVESLGDGGFAIVMQYVRGGTLYDALRERGPLPFQRAAAVLRDVAEALAYAHAQGIVHRDVKPENIFLEESTGRALLSDFGIARRIGRERGLTLKGNVIGTPTYMAPEQITGGAVDGRSDLYALGLVGWEMLTGRRPWTGDTVYEVIYQQKHDQLPRLTLLTPGIPEPLLFAIEGALHKDPGSRWANAEEFLAQLLERPSPALANPERPGSAVPTVRFRRPAGPIWRSARGRRTSAAGVAAGLLMALTALLAHQRATPSPAAPGGEQPDLSGVPAPLVSATVLPLPNVGREPPAPAPVRGPAHHSSVRAVALRAPRARRIRRPDGPNDQCRTPGANNQQACVMALLARGDAPLVRAYERVVVQLKRSAGTVVGDPEPRSVRWLREDQKRWLAYRNQECFRRGLGHEGALWGSSRARCLTTLAVGRTRALTHYLHQIGGD